MFGRFVASTWFACKTERQSKTAPAHSGAETVSPAGRVEFSWPRATRYRLTTEAQCCEHCHPEPPSLLITAGRHFNLSLAAIRRNPSRDSCICLASQAFANLPLTASSSLPTSASLELNRRSAVLATLPCARNACARYSRGAMTDLTSTLAIAGVALLGLVVLASGNRHRARAARAARRGVTWLEARPVPGGWQLERRRHAKPCGRPDCKTCELIAQTIRELEQLHAGPRWVRALKRWAVGDPIRRAYELEGR